MTVTQALFGFLREPVRHDIGKNHHAAGVCLKIACWVNFVIAILVAVGGLIVSLLVLLSAAFWSTIQDNLDAPQWILDLGAGVAVVGAILVLFFTLIAVTLLLLYLWWKNHTYQLWNQVAPNAIIWANVLAAVMLALSLGGTFGSFDFVSIQDGSSTSQAVRGGGGGDLITVVLSVLILAFANVASSKGELDLPAAEQAAEGPGQS